MSPQRSRIQAEHGFTLLEVTFTVMIIAILLAMAVATFVATTGAASAAACRSNQDALNKAIVIAASAGVSVGDIADLTPYVKNFDGIRVCPKDGTPLTLDTTTNSVACPNHPQ